MKKIAIVLVISLLLVALCACGDVTESMDAVPVEEKMMSETADEAVVPQAEESVAEKKEPVTEENIRPSDDDFSVADLGDGTCEILSCYIETDILDVPETICGLIVVGIGQNAFSESNATQINLPDTVEYIDSMAFSLCENLEIVEFGTGLKQIGEMVFNYCDKLKSLSFPDGMTTTEGLMLGQCNELEDVYIPASVVDIPGGITFTALCPNIVIITPAGSVAESVAIENGLPVQNN